MDFPSSVSTQPATERLLTMNDLLGNVSEAEGKTVKGVECAGGFAAVHFTDGTTLLLGSEGDCDCSDCSPDIYDTARLPTRADVLFGLGFIDHQGYLAKRQEQDIAAREVHEAAERARYEELKAKFESAQSRGN
jgi:hypothetical protein